MISLAIKYRPHSWDAIVEQSSVKQILQEQLKTNSQKNCYLFTGGAGTGKTTCARIFANEINKGAGTPIEIDAASNNGVDNIRDIIDNAKFKALDAPYKVYIIDEVHMLSIGAFNALLKLLEEPPTQTIFILCTTDPQKIPATILSRVQRYDFKRITYESVVNRLSYICQQEHIEYEEQALGYIAKTADGGMRDAITLLDKCVSFNPQITVEAVVEAVGTVDYATMFALTTNLLQRNSTEAIKVIEEAYRQGIDLKQLMKQYSVFLVDVYKYQLLRSFEYLQIPAYFEQQCLSKYTESDFAEVLSLLDVIIKLNVDIKWEQNSKALVEATLLLFCSEVE